MKMNLLTILISLVLSFCMKANLNNIADPNKGSGIFYAYSLVPMGLTGSQEIIPVALATEITNLPETISNGTTVNNIEIKFNKEIDFDTTVTIKSSDSALKVNGLSQATLNFTKANARSPQTFSIAAVSESLTDITVTLDFESPILPNTSKTILLKNSANQQAFIVKDLQGTLLTSGSEVNALPGDQFTYAIALKYKPDENFTVLLETSTYSGSPTLDKRQLIFTAQNYNVPQSFTVTFPTISASTDSSNSLKSYSIYAKLSSGSVGFFANYSQNLIPAIVISGATTLNKGSSNNLGISLSHKPDANRTVSISLSQSNFLSLNKTSFTFTPANYNIPQTLQVIVSSQNYIFGAVTATFSTTGGYPNNQVKININDTSNSYLDVSGGDVSRTGFYPSMAIDTVNSKLLIAKMYHPSADTHYYYFSQLRLSICDLDGSNCVNKDVSAMAGQGNGSGNFPSIAIDTVNSKILISTENSANNTKPSLFRCELNGSSCTHTDISAGRGNRSGLSPKLLIDTVNNKILLFTSNSETGYTEVLSLFRCNLDGTSCTFSDISAGKGTVSAYRNVGLSRIAAGIDYTNSKILAVTQNNFVTNNQRPSLFRCDLDGSNCTYTDISAGQGDKSGKSPSLAIDSVNGKLFVATMRDDGAYNYYASVFKCNLDGTSCSHTNLSSFFFAEAFFNTISIDQTNAKILVATAYQVGDKYYPGLYRCSFNMTGCSFNNLALTNETILSSTGTAVDLVIDTISATNRILVAVADENTKKSKLIRVLRNYVD